MFDLVEAEPSLMPASDAALMTQLFGPRWTTMADANNQQVAANIAALSAEQLAQLPAVLDSLNALHDALSSVGTFDQHLKRKDTLRKRAFARRSAVLLRQRGGGDGGGGGAPAAAAAVDSAAAATVGWSEPSFQRSSGGDADEDHLLDAEAEEEEENGHLTHAGGSPESDSAEDLRLLAQSLLAYTAAVAAAGAASGSGRVPDSGSSSDGGADGGASSSGADDPAVRAAAEAASARRAMAEAATAAMPAELKEHVGTFMSSYDRYVDGSGWAEEAAEELSSEMVGIQSLVADLQQLSAVTGDDFVSEEEMQEFVGRLQDVGQEVAMLVAAEANLTDPAARDAARYIGTQLLVEGTATEESEESEEPPPDEFQCTPEVVDRLSIFIEAAQKWQVYQRFLAACRQADPDLVAAALQVALVDPNARVGGLDWWVRPVASLRDDELAAAQRRPGMLLADHAMVQIVANLPAQDLRFMTAMVASDYSPSALIKWSLHPEVGPRIMSGQLSLDAVRDRLSEAAAAADDGGGLGGWEEAMWRGMDGAWAQAVAGAGEGALAASGVESE